MTVQRVTKMLMEAILNYTPSMSALFKLLEWVQVQLGEHLNSLRLQSLLEAGSPRLASIA